MSKLSELIQQYAPNGVKKVPLSEVGKFTRGRRFVKNDMISEGIPCIHYGELYTHYGVWTNQAKSFISPELAKKLRFARTGNVIIVAAGETIEDIGKGVAWLADTDVVVHDACYIFEHNLDPKYVSYFLRTRYFHSQIKRYISSGKISSISADGLGKALIPVPPIPVQRKIVEHLDNFTELAAELAAELATRKKQCEYYRDALLRFEGVEGAAAGGVKWVKLGEIANYRRGSFPQPYGNREWYDGEKAMPFVQVADVGEDMRLVSNTKRKIGSAVRLSRSGQKGGRGVGW
jgi:type I restriction enzyme, S subunit